MTPDREQGVVHFKYGDLFGTVGDCVEECPGCKIEALQARCADLERERDEVLEANRVLVDDARERFAELEPATLWAQRIARAALAVPGRPGSGAPTDDDTQSLLTSKGMGGLVRGMQEPPPTNPSGAPAECPHCHVELVDGTCVAGCYYRVPETQEDTP